MSVKKVLPALTALGCIIHMTVPAFAQTAGFPVGSYNPNANYAAPPAHPNYHQGQVSYVPAGMTFPVTLNTSISTDLAKAGDMVQATLNQPIYLGTTLIPQGSVVLGTITNAKAGGFLGRAGMLEIKFNRLRTPNGVETPMTAHIVGGVGKYGDVGSDQSDSFRGETWKTKAGQAAIRGTIGAGAGAALGTAIGAIAGRGRGLGRGAWSGAAIGGGLGVAQSVLLRKGKNVLMSSGQQMQLQLDAPMSVVSNVQTGAF